MEVESGEEHQLDLKDCDFDNTNAHVQKFKNDKVGKKILRQRRKMDELVEGALLAELRQLVGSDAKPSQIIKLADPMPLRKHDASEIAKTNKKSLQAGSELNSDAPARLFHFKDAKKYRNIVKLMKNEITVLRSENKELKDVIGELEIRNNEVAAEVDQIINAY